MDFFDIIRKRRSIRKFKQTKIDKEKIDLLMESVLRAPSSRSIRPWEFYFVDDPTLLAKFAECRPHSAEFLRTAALAVVICADTTKSDVWIEDCSIAATYLQLAATALGLGSCWVQIRNRKHESGKSSSEYISELLGLSPNVQVECIVGIGEPAENLRPHPFSSLPKEKIIKIGF